MNMKVSFSALCCILTLLVSSHSLAQEAGEVEKQNGDVLSIAKQPQRSLWETSVETTWLPGSTTYSPSGDRTGNDVKTAE